jgi:hypothetical protein
MNPIALGMIGLGIILLFVGAASLAKNEKMKGMALSIAGLAAIAAPFAVSYLLAR